MLNTSYEVPCFYRSRMFYKAFEALHGPRLFLNGTGGYFITEWFEEQLGIEDTILDEGHTVMNLLTEVAANLGCNPIIYVGMDLAYTNMQQYAKGVRHDATVSEQLILSCNGYDSSAFLRNDIFGEPVYTLWKWINESDWISNYAKIQPSIKFINATEGGIGFRDIENKSFKDVSNTLLKKRYDLQMRVHADVQNAAMPQVTSEKVLALFAELEESLEQCLEHSDGLLSEIEVVRKRIKDQKSVPENLQTGEAALHEVDLTDELAYDYILSTLATACTKIMERQYYQARFDKSLRSTLERNLRKLDVNKKKVEFLKEATVVNLDIMNDCIRKYRQLEKLKVNV
jgi:hypothetical protein